MQGSDFYALNNVKPVKCETAVFNQNQNDIYTAQDEFNYKASHLLKVSRKFEKSDSNANNNSNVYKFSKNEYNPIASVNSPGNYNPNRVSGGAQNSIQNDQDSYISKGIMSPKSSKYKFGIRKFMDNERGGEGQVENQLMKKAHALSQIHQEQGDKFYKMNQAVNNFDSNLADKYCNEIESMITQENQLTSQYSRAVKNFKDNNYQKNFNV